MAATPSSAVGLVALAGGGGIGALSWLAGRQRRRAEEMAAQVARLQAVLAAVPQPWCGWAADGEQTIDPGFAPLLAHGPIATPADVMAALAPGDAAAVGSAMAVLTGTGTPFRLELGTADGRRLMLSGRRGAAAGGDAVHTVLWLEDVTVQAQAGDGAEAARRAAEAEVGRLRAALEALPVPVWMRGPDQALVWCNRAYARAVETEPAQAVAGGRELVPGEGGRPMAARARAEGTAQSRRCTVAFGTERRLLEVSEVSIPLPGGGVLALGYALDRTEQEGLRGELDRHQVAHAEVLERLGSAISVFGPDTRLKFYNQAYARLWELDEAFLRTEPTHGELLEDLRARRKLPEYADFQSFKRDRLTRYTRLIEPMEEMMHLPDGTTLRVLVAPHPLGGLISIMEDVTNTLALESSYNTLIAVQQETLDNLAEGIAVFGGDGRLKLSNPSYARIWDLADQDLLGEPHIADILEHMRPLFVEDGGGAENWDSLKDEMIGATLERAVRSGRLERKDGSVVEFSTVPLPDGAVLNSYLDVTDSARLEQALRASNAALEAADQLKTEFIANVSHHLRTPLNGIIGYAEVLANQYFGPLTARQLEYTKGVLAAGERLLTLIDDVVDLTSIGAGVTALEHGTVDLAEMLESVAGLTQDWARREGLRLDLAIAPRLGTLPGDEKRLKQALFTLVVAAIRAPAPSGRVILRGERCEERVILTVGDPAAAEAAPGPARFDGARSDPALGMALVRNVIALHGGGMDVIEAPGCGVLVRCTLPEAVLPRGTA